MTVIAAFPPDQHTIEHAAATLPQRRMSPGVVGGLAGPGALGPEAAGALSLVYGSFADTESAQRGYRHFTDAQRALLDAPGFLRWISFADGPHGYGLGFWRSADDAVAFARRPVHRAMVAEQRARPFEYSQFAGIWAAHTIGRRTYACPECSTVTAAPAAECSGFGVRLDDGFGVEHPR